MTPEEKALYLVDNVFLPLFPSGRSPIQSGGVPLYNRIAAKEAALICVDEIIEVIGQCSIVKGHPLDYWQEVTREIEKL